MYPWCHAKPGSRHTHSRNRSLYSGRVADWLVLKLARQNKGIMEPEQRLWLFGLSALLIPGGLILEGCGHEHPYCSHLDKLLHRLLSGTQR